MFDGKISRRSLLKIGTGVAAGGIGLTWLPSALAKAVFTPGVARTVGVEPPTYIPRPSDEVEIERVGEDGERGRPNNPGNGRGRSSGGRGSASGNGPPANRSGSGRETAIRITSNSATTHYAFSLVQIGREQLKVRDIESLSYEYYVPEDGSNTVGEDTSVAPDEVWLILQKSGGGVKQVFRTWPVQEQTTANTWVTRDVYEELRKPEDSPSPWKRLDESAATFQVVGSDLVDAYGEARVIGAGVGRGDPVMGPSQLEIQYDNLKINERSYAFPV